MSMRWEVNLGFDRLRANTRTAEDAAVKTGMSFLRSVVDPLVPVETGALAGSGDVGAGQKAGAGPAGEHVAHLYYPGPYALYQHEGVYFRRPAHFGKELSHTHGQSFFLIQPLISHKPEIITVTGQVVLKGMHR